MARDLRAYLWDVLQAAHDIQSFVTGKNENDYAQNAMLRAAVERKLEIIGEALQQAKRFFPEAVDRISDSQQVIALRNRLIHGYSTVSDSLIWEVLQEDLPILLQAAQTLLDELAP